MIKVYIYVLYQYFVTSNNKYTSLQTTVMFYKTTQYIIIIRRKTFMTQWKWMVLALCMKQNLTE